MDKKALFQSGITKREKKSSRPYSYFHVELEQVKRKNQKMKTINMAHYRKSNSSKNTNMAFSPAYAL